MTQQTVNLTKGDWVVADGRYYQVLQPVALREPDLEAQVKAGFLERATSYNYQQWAKKNRFKAIMGFVK